MKWTPIFLRNVAFAELQALQDDCRRQIVENPDVAFLIASEPHATFTAGVSANPSDKVWSEEECAKRNIAIHRVHRGGKWTYHGPGQILFYPLFKFDRVFPRSRVRGYLDCFRNSLVRTMTSHVSKIDIQECHKDRPFGVYLRDSAKLVSFGVGIQRGVSSNGCAIYLEGSPYLGGIVPCGVSQQRFSTLQSQNWKLDWEASANLFSSNLLQDFETARVKEFSSN